MADDKLLWFLGMEFADDYGQEFFFQDEYDDSLALAMAAVDDNIITFKYVIFIFLTVKNQTWRRYLVRTNKNKMSIFRTQRRFFPLSSLTAEKSAMRNWTVNFRLSLTSLSSSLSNWTPSVFSSQKIEMRLATAAMIARAFQYLPVTVPAFSRMLSVLNILTDYAVDY